MQHAVYSHNAFSLLLFLPGGQKPTINIKADHLSSMGVKSSGCDPPLQSENLQVQHLQVFGHLNTYSFSTIQTRHTFEKQKGGGEPPPALRASFSHFQFTTISDHNKVASVKLQHNFEQVKSGSDLTAKPSASLQFQTEPSGKFKQVSLWVRNTRYKQFDNQIAYEPAPTDTSKLVSLWVRNTRFKTLF
nr:uncharacterized protein LOC129157140 isoform X2 [Nothobranchius furzeri]